MESGAIFWHPLVLHVYDAQASFTWCRKTPINIPTVPVVMYRVSPWKWISTSYHRFKSLETCIFFLLMWKQKSFTGVQGPIELQICSVTLKVLLSIMCLLGQGITPRQEDQTQVYMWMRTSDLRYCFIGTFPTEK